MTADYGVVWLGDRTVVGPRGGFAAVVRWAAKMPRVYGPTGPVAYCVIRRPDGSRVDSWYSEARLHGLTPLVVTGVRGERMVDVAEESV